MNRPRDTIANRIRHLADMNHTLSEQSALNAIARVYAAGLSRSSSSLEATRLEDARSAVADFLNMCEA